MQQKQRDRVIMTVDLPSSYMTYWQLLKPTGTSEPAHSPHFAQNFPSHMVLFVICLNLKYTLKTQNAAVLWLHVKK